MAHRADIYRCRAGPTGLAFVRPHLAFVRPHLAFVRPHLAFVRPHLAFVRPGPLNVIPAKAGIAATHAAGDPGSSPG